jgi:hypothetical protein
VSQAPEHGSLEAPGLVDRIEVTMQSLTPGTSPIVRPSAFMGTVRPRLLMLVAMAAVAGWLGFSSVSAAPGRSGQASPDPRVSDEDAEQREKMLEHLKALGYVSATDTINPKDAGVTLFNKASAATGYSLYSDGTNAIYLIDREGKRSHVWWLPDVPKEFLYPELVAGGNLAVISTSESLSLLNAGAKPIWTLPGNFHHDLTELPDGNLMVLYREKQTYRGREIMFDGLKIVSLKGEARDAWFSFDHLDSIRKHHETSKLDTPMEPKKPGTPSPRYDYFHMNAVSVLPETSLGSKDSRFKAGNLLVCFRNVNLIAIMDGKSYEIVWSWGPGTLDLPHQPTMLDNGRILIFDNGTYRNFSRVLEIDPVGGKIRWKYQADPKEGFYTREGGGSLRLDNGNTFITESHKGHAFEVTRSGEIVWEFWNPNMRGPKRRTFYRMTHLTAEDVAPLLEQAR